MGDINSKINKIILKERLVCAIKWSIPLALILGAFALLSMPPLGEIHRIEGVAKNMLVMPNDDQDKLYLVVRLEYNSTVRTIIPRVTYYKKGERVQLEKQASWFDGTAFYRFKKYL